MSKVTNVLENNQESSKCLVFYNKSSIDSIFGAGIIRYICEEITDVGEEVECKDINEISSEISSDYINVSFIGCYPTSNLLKKYVDYFREKTLFVLSDAFDYNIVKGYNRNINIEYSEKDSCALQLYKIAFGEFKDRIPKILQLISVKEMKEFDNEKYYDSLQLGIGFIKYFNEQGFENIYENIILPICNQLDNYIDFDFSQYINNGRTISSYYNDYLLQNLSTIKNDKFIFSGTKNTNVLITNSMLDLSTGDLKDEFENEYILAFSRRDINNWNVEFIYNVCSYTYSYSYQIPVINTEIPAGGSEANQDGGSAIEPGTNEPGIDSDINIENNYTSYSYSYSGISIPEINCAYYIKKYYKGIGTEDHAFTTITNDQFLKIMKAKKF